MEEFEETYKAPLHDYKEDRVELPKSFKIISCPNCATEVPADNLNINDKIGKCGSCAAVFSIANDVLALQKNTPKVTQEILRPEGIELFHFRDELEISFEQPMTWGEWTSFFVLMLFWFIGTVMGIKMANAIPFVAIAVVPSIFAYIYFRRRKDEHRKSIYIDDDELSIIWRPKMLQSNQRYATKDINQLYVKYNPNMGDWNVFMLLDEGNGAKHVKLTSLKTVSKAKYLEQIIEKQLGLVDVKVTGEA